ncbi:MAG: hypothetical protein GY871_04000 [Actinomycetales bacterium]|nr:hypothetical protein [Actinomycetales bacterium]
MGKSKRATKMARLATALSGGGVLVAASDTEAVAASVDRSGNEVLDLVFRDRLGNFVWFQNTTSETTTFFSLGTMIRPKARGVEILGPWPGVGSDLIGAS